MAKHGKDKNKAVKLPKQVAGVKIPKELRKGGERLIAQAQNSEGRAVIAKGVSLVAGAAAAMAQAAAVKKQATTPTPLIKPGEPGPDHPGAHPDALGDAIGAGVEAVLGRLFAKR